VLLSDARVIRFVNDHFVACWQTVRPVPQVTIQFGDGRTLKRTLGGNTVMEICLPDGRVVDSFPGVYMPDDFLSEAGQTLVLLQRLLSAPAGAATMEADIIAWHRARAAVPPVPVTISLEKSMVESPLLRALRANPRQAPNTDLLVRELGRAPVGVEEGVDARTSLARISQRIEDVSKQPATIEQLRRRLLNLPEDRRPSPAELGEMALRLDSRTNVNWLRPAVHLLFAGDDRLPRNQECRDFVFNQLLHLPVNDPYLGLAGALVPGTSNGP
jgi:hypothetical protein